MIEILSPGEKIRKIRKELRISQQDLESEEVSRSMISKLERGHSNLLSETAKSIAKKMNEIILEKQSNMHLVNWQELIESEKDQIERAMVKYRVRLKEVKMSEISIEKCETFFDEIQDFISRNSVRDELRLSVYIDIADFYGSRFLWEERIRYALSSYDLAIKLESIDNFFWCLKALTEALYRLGRYRGVIIYGEHAEAAIKIHEYKNIDLIKKIYFNVAVAYKELKNYDLCLRYLTILEYEQLDFKGQLLIAECYYKLEMQEKAEAIYYDLIEAAIEEEVPFRLATAYRATAWCKIGKGDFEAARNLLDKANSIKIKETNYIYSYITLEIEIAMGNVEYTERNYLDILNDAIDKKDEKIVIRLLNKVFDLYARKRQFKYAERLLRVIRNKIFDRMIKNRQLSELFFKCISCFNKQYPHECGRIMEEGMRIIEFFEIENITY